MRNLLGKALHVRWVPDIGGTPLPIVWDEDVADLVLLAMRHRAHGAFNACADDLLSAQDLEKVTEFKATRHRGALVLLYRLMHDALSYLGIYLPDPAWQQHTYGAMLVGTSNRAKSELGWRPKYPTAKCVLDRFCELVPLGLDFRLQVYLRVACSLVLTGAVTDRDSYIINLCVDSRSGRDLALICEQGAVIVRAGPVASATGTIELSDMLLKKIVLGLRPLLEQPVEQTISFTGRNADWDSFVQLVGRLSKAPKQRNWRGLFLRALARALFPSLSLRDSTIGQ